MKKAKIFLVGGSQAVRLPKGFSFEEDEVCISKLDDVVILYPKGKGWDVLESGIRSFSGDFMAQRGQPANAQRRARL